MKGKFAFSRRYLIVGIISSVAGGEGCRGMCCIVFENCALLIVAIIRAYLEMFAQKSSCGGSFDEVPTYAICKTHTLKRFAEAFFEVQMK
eukprot:scaffold301626_cov20-Prasinocladus_malaysianus.AAC.1